MSEQLPSRERFEEAYQGNAPWDIGRPQKALIAIADRVQGSVLDAGCGTGENSLLFAQQGHTVYGIDFLSQPIAIAKQKASARNLDATFVVMDALALGEIPHQFDSVIDCGLFHCFSDEDRVQYVTGLAATLRAGGRLFLLCFSDKEPGTDGPRRISRQEIVDSFSAGWRIESLQASRFEVRPDITDLQFSAGGPHAWVCVIQRL